MYILLDANVVAGYYLPRSMPFKRARDRIECILDSVRSKATDHFLYIPNFCIAEVFSVFAKHAFGDWNPHVKRSGGPLDKRVYQSLRDQFAKDIHNARLFYHYELSRYHILGIDLVAPVDHYFQITRGKKKNHRPAGTFDHLIISMGVHLAHIHGQDNVCLVTADDRLSNVLDKCRVGLPARTLRKLKLDNATEVAGKPFGPTIFPRCLNLKTATNSELADVFGVWPPPVGDIPDTYRWLRT